MANFGGAFGVLIIIVVTLAQLLGANKRSKGKGPRRSADEGPRDDRELLRKPAATQNKNSTNKSIWSNMAKKKDQKSGSQGKISAGETTTSFEVDGSKHNDVQGFDVK